METRPEEVDVLHDERTDECHLLIVGLGTMACGESFQQVHFYQRVVAVEAVGEGSHRDDGFHLLVLGHQFGMTDKSFILLGPFFVEECLLQYVDVLLSHLPVVGKQTSLGHVFQHIDTPTKLHAILHAPTIAEAFFTIMIIEKFAAHLRHAYLPRGMLLFSAFGITEHFVTNPAEAEKGQILHHHHDSGGRHGFAHILIERNAKHTLPVESLYGVVHCHFLMEVGVAFPALRYTPASEADTQET